MHASKTCQLAGILTCCNEAVAIATCTYRSIVSVELLCVTLEHFHFAEQVLLEAGLDLNQVILNLSL